MATADNLSDAVREIGAAYYLSGYPAALVTYALIGEFDRDLYVRIVPGRVKDVTGPAALLPYFSDLKGERTPLTSARLEADRALADGLTERGGAQYKPSFKRVGGDEVVLDLGEATTGSRQFALIGVFSNYGNRYAGPYVANAAFRQDFDGGYEISLSGATSVHIFGLGGAHSVPYHEGEVGWSKVTPFGVFGLQGRYADFSPAEEGYIFHGAISSGSATWMFPLYADLHQRLNLQGKIERDHEAIDAPATTLGCNALDNLLNLLGLLNCPLQITAGGEALSELYNSAELSLGYTGRVQHDERQDEFKLSLTLRKGLGPHQSTGSSASLDYFLWQPAFSARYSLTPRWSVLGDGSFQFTNSIVPQQQQFVIGGFSSLHAYEAGVGVGDRGENLSLSVEWKGYADSWIEHYGIRPRCFVEYGSTTLKSRSLGVSNGTVTVADVGAAVDVRFASWLAGSLSLAQSTYSRGGENSPDGLAKKYLLFQLAAQY